uniref:Uncharacterized protein n=1 Tax=Oryza meridionalis TaxID=40149 RepID=A0A0E0DYD9_9ORYZ
MAAPGAERRVCGAKARTTAGSGDGGGGHGGSTVADADCCDGDEAAAMMVSTAVAGDGGQLVAAAAVEAVSCGRRLQAGLARLAAEAGTARRGAAGGGGGTASCGSGRASWRPAAVWSRGRRHGARGRRQRVLVAAVSNGERLVAMAVATVDRRSVTLSGGRFGVSLLSGCVLALSGYNL